jgi:hypothetical protein
VRGADLLAARQAGELHRHARVLALLGGGGAVARLVLGGRPRLARDRRRLAQALDELIHQEGLVHPPQIKWSAAGPQKSRDATG